MFTISPRRTLPCVLLETLLLCSTAVLSVTTTSSSTLQGAACINLPAPVQLQIRNITLQDDGIRRGIATTVGIPPQELAFQITKLVMSVEADASL